MGKIIGIDLGTTNSAMAVMQSGKPEIIANSEGNRTTPSVVAVNKKGERLVGQIARRQQVTISKDTIYEMKRLMGRKWTDKEVQKENLEIKVAELNNELNKLDKDKRVGYGTLYTWDIKIDRNIIDLLVNEIITVDELVELADLVEKTK